MAVAGRSAGKAAEIAEWLLAEGKSIWRCHSSTNAKARRRSCCCTRCISKVHNKVYMRAYGAEHPNTRAI